MEIIDRYELIIIYNHRIKYRLYSFYGKFPTAEQIKDIKIKASFKAFDCDGRDIELDTESMTKCLIALDEVLPDDK